MEARKGENTSKDNPYVKGSLPIHDEEKEGKKSY